VGHITVSSARSPGPIDRGSHENPEPDASPAADVPPPRSVWQRSVTIWTLLVCGTLIATGYINSRLAQLEEFPP
jgi:hypothetical protein